MFDLFNLLVGVVLSVPIGYASLRKKALTHSGIISAFLLGVIIAGFGGLTWFAMLLSFYLTSSILTKYKKQEKSFVVDKFQKGGQRDIGQVLANGLIALIMVLLINVYHTDIFFAGFIGAVATVTADTWGTELGVLSKSKPILITSFKPVEPGTSGAISKLGIAATIFGSLIVGIVGFLFSGIRIIITDNFSFQQYIFPFSVSWIILVGIIGGTVGAFVDSLLGATVQAMFYCDVCEKETEKVIHTCGNATRHIRGIRVLDNDGVNLVSSLAGAVVSMLIYYILFMAG